jgi:hypothetical protein
LHISGTLTITIFLRSGTSKPQSCSKDNEEAGKEV